MCVCYYAIKICIHDNIVTKAELITGGQENYNENIDPGRSALLGAMYVVPEDAKSIDLEYDPLGEYSDRIVIKIKKLSFYMQITYLRR